jgi:hypothetical protein
LKCETSYPKVSPTFKIFSNAPWTNTLVIKNILKEGLNPWSLPSLRDFRDTSKVWLATYQITWAAQTMFANPDFK